MRKNVVWLLGCGVLLVAGSARAGGERPLVVAVEVDPGGAADAAQVRRAIGDELHRPVLAPAEAAADEAMSPDTSDLLLVAVDRGRIALSFRRQSDAVIARKVPAPGDRSARLRAIAWLAGNLTRDQVTPFLSATADTGAFATTEPATSPPVAATPAPSQPPASSAPAPTSPARFDPAETSVVSSPTASTSGEGLWAFAAVVGPATRGRGGSPDLLLLTQIELVKRRRDGWFWGFGIDFESSIVRDPASFWRLPSTTIVPAALALGGTEWRWERTRVELSLGLGLSKGPVYSTTIQTSSTGGSETNQTISETINDGWQPYARTAVTVSRALSTRWEILARLDAQETFGGAADPTAAAMFGLRRNLP